ncbi:MAG: ATP-binding cassette domain-containing protein [Pseudomonadota bacterium]
MSDHAVIVRSLSHSYGSRPALKDVSFELRRGHFLALLGPNGAGKTTLFSLLTRLLAAPPGSIELLGHDLRRYPREAMRRLGVVFQQPTLDLDLSVAQNLAYHGALQGMPPAEVRRRSQEELERFKLADRSGDRVRDLNGGHRRRVEIARALLHGPGLLLLDEASAGLDLETRRALYRHVRELGEERGTAVLWTTHLVEELDAEDETLVLHRGELIARGSLEALRQEQGSDTAEDAILALTRSAA